MRRTQHGFRGFRPNTFAESLHDMWQLVRVLPSGCWQWRGGRTEAGYAHLWILGKMHYVHQIMYELYKGPIPSGLEPDHTCRRRWCVNPDHLEAVTHQVNNQRGYWGRKRRCPHGHPLDGRRKGEFGPVRYCLTCNRLRAAKWRAA